MLRPWGEQSSSNWDWACLLLPLGIRALIMYNCQCDCGQNFVCIKNHLGTVEMKGLQGCSSRTSNFGGLTVVLQSVFLMDRRKYRGLMSQALLWASLSWQRSKLVPPKVRMPTASPTPPPHIHSTYCLSSNFTGHVWAVYRENTSHLPNILWFLIQSAQFLLTPPLITLVSYNLD